MILYLGIIFCSILLIFGANVLLELEVGQILVELSIAFAIVLAVDIVVAVVVHAYPERKINPFKKIFGISKKERAIYNRLKIKKWKDIIPESGKYLCHFAKDKILEPNNNEYVHKFLIETIYAEIMHEISLVLGFLPMFFCGHVLSITLWVCLVNAFLQALPVMVQRYNRIRLYSLYKFNERRMFVVKNEEINMEEEDVIEKIC